MEKQWRGIIKVVDCTIQMGVSFIRDGFVRVTRLGKRRRRATLGDGKGKTRDRARHKVGYLNIVELVSMPWSTYEHGDSTHRRPADHRDSNYRAPVTSKETRGGKGDERTRQEEDASMRTRPEGRDKETRRGGRSRRDGRREYETDLCIYAAHATTMGEGGGSKGRERRKTGDATERDGRQNPTKVGVWRGQSSILTQGQQRS